MSERVRTLSVLSLKFLYIFFSAAVQILGMHSLTLCTLHSALAWPLFY